MSPFKHDPYYSSAFAQYQSMEIMKEAGYMETRMQEKNRHSNESIHWLVTPYQKIIDNLRQKRSIKKNRPIVLVTTGGFSPIHTGHMDMLHIAKKTLEEAGRIVVGGYISPSHDMYTSQTISGKKILPTPYRLRLCELAVVDSDWLMVDSWESRYNKGLVNFTDVLMHIEAYLKAHISNVACDVYYVFGSDNASFARAFVAYGGCVCIQRAGYEKEYRTIRKDPLLTSNKNIFFASNRKKSAHASSRHIVAGDGRFHTQFTKQEYTQWMSHTRDSAVIQYAIRNDTAYATSIWNDGINRRQISGAADLFYKDLAMVIAKSFQSSKRIEGQRAIKILPLNVESQQAIVNDIARSDDIINLDICTHGGIPLRVSRMFEASGGQCRSLRIVSRPGYKSIVNQMQAISSGAYVLVDDDIAYGHQYHKQLHKLLSHITIKRDVSLMEELLGHIPIYDVVDFRDFLAGTKGGGLVVELPNHKIARVPYMLPYVSLVSRAKISPSQEYQLSIKLWELNVRFHRSLPQAILLKDADIAFRWVMNYIGFDNQTALLDICKWHLQKLRS